MYILQKAFAALCQSTHLYGRRLVLEWAKMEEDIDELRKRTAKQLYGSKLFLCLLCIFKNNHVYSTDRYDRYKS